jgi:hypothetical protein
MSENATVDLASLRYRDPANADPNRPRPYHDFDNLKTLYHGLGWGQSEIAGFYNVDQSTISRAMDKAGVEARPPIDKRQANGGGQ